MGRSTVNTKDRQLNVTLQLIVKIYCGQIMISIDFQCLYTVAEGLDCHRCKLMSLNLQIMVTHPLWVKEDTDRTQGTHFFYVLTDVLEQYHSLISIYFNV